MTETLPAQPIAVKDVPTSASGGGTAGASTPTSNGTERLAKPAALTSVASTANQILFKNELYTSMKQKTMDQELMATLTKKAQEDEKRQFERAKAAVDRLANKRKVLVGVGDMTGQPGSDSGPYSSASISVDLSPGDTVRDVKKKLITALKWADENPEDFGLFDDTSEEPLKDALLIESALSAAGKPPSASKSGASGGGRRAGGWGKSTTLRLPRPYVGLLWAARSG